ncbi:MAG: Bug family tripartite tricarboxylate transporter substrate binding protein [Rhodospirillaceae bacterium]
MKMWKRMAVAAVCVAATTGAQAQDARDYPNKPVRWVVPFTPGASNDIIARLMGSKLGEAWGQQFIIDNRPGAGGAVGAETVAKASPDGYTLLLANPGPSVNTPLLLKNALYKVGDFTPVVFIGYAPLIILANPSFPPRNPRELIDYAKANPGKINWGSSGNGSSLHIGLALLQAATGIKVQHVPYKGSGPAITDLIAGQIQAMHTTTVSAESQIKAGRVRVIGVASAKRISLLPDVPTLAESGIKDAEAIVWFGMSGPPGLPRAIVEKLNREVNKALTLPDVKARLDQLGLEVGGGTPQEFANFIKNEAAKVSKLIRAGLLHAE